MLYRFEDCTLDTLARELKHRGALLAVEPQVFDLLDYLIRHHERAVCKEELLNSVWRGRAVSNSTLGSRINAARTAIGDNGSEQRLIRTLRSKGFRFVGEVCTENKSVPVTPTVVMDDSAIASVHADRPALAVLPLVNLVDDPKQERIADGLTDDLITALAKADWFSTASRSFSFAHKGRSLEAQQVARKRGIRYILQGSMRSAADCHRISVQLVDGLTDRNIWAERYDGTISEVVAAQDEIVEKVTRAIEARLYQAEHVRTERKSAESLTAWDCTVRALSLIDTREERLVQNARSLMLQATTLEPRSARSLSLLSFITTLNVHQGWKKRQRELPQAQGLAHTALSLNSEEPWAFVASGYAKIWVRPEDAIPDLLKALALNPSLAIAHYLLALAFAYAGRGDSALGHGDMAERLGAKDLLARGNSGAHHNVRATACFTLGRYQEGMDFGRKAIAESPTMPTAYRSFLMNCSLAGHLDEAQRAMAMLLRFSPKMSLQWLRETTVWARREDQQRYLDAFRIAGLRP
jgi:TolB-like protein